MNIGEVDVTFGSRFDRTHRQVSTVKSRSAKNHMLSLFSGTVMLVCPNGSLRCEVVGSKVLMCGLLAVMAVLFLWSNTSYSEHSLWLSFSSSWDQRSHAYRVAEIQAMPFVRKGLLPYCLFSGGRFLHYWHAVSVREQRWQCGPYSKFPLNLLCALCTHTHACDTQPPEASRSQTKNSINEKQTTAP